MPPHAESPRAVQVGLVPLRRRALATTLGGGYHHDPEITAPPTWPGWSPSPRRWAPAR